MPQCSSSQCSRGFAQRPSVVLIRAVATFPTQTCRSVLGFERTTCSTHLATTEDRMHLDMKHSIPDASKGVKLFKGYKGFLKESDDLFLNWLRGSNAMS